MNTNRPVCAMCIAYCVKPNLWKRLLPHEKHRHRQSHFNCCIDFQNQANTCKGKGKKCLSQKGNMMFYFAILHWRKQMLGYKNMRIDIRFICIFHFWAGVLFSIENAKFWPILINLGYFVANLFTFQCTIYRPRSTFYRPE